MEVPEPKKEKRDESPAQTNDPPEKWRVSCLFLKGENSDYIEQQHLPIIQSIFPKSSVKTIEAVGHWLHAEKPELFNQIVLQFIGEIS